VADLLIATTNPGKIREILGILDGVPVSLVTLADCDAIPEPAETGATFAENARLKAIYYAGASGLPAVADDSGLEIEALGNAPGVHSARWHGDDYAVKFRAIYRELAGRGLSTSPARFVAHVTLAHRGKVLFESTGTVAGEIASSPRGNQGFGYDPIFFYPPYGVTLGEVSGERKAAVSHRGQAFRQLRDRLLAEPDILAR
jgi:XTP/dITP diphosphohydrolase